MKLELKHSAAYLPYKLKCTRIKSDNKFVKDFGIKELIGLSFNTNRECFVGIFENSELDINQIVPFLYPFSDLTKEIEVNGEKFIPIDNLKQEFLIDYFVFGEYKFGWTGFIDPIGNNHFPIYMKNEIMDECSYLFYQKLCAWHFDIFGLIDAGLAVDINTVKF
jgi:hypothetical protein